MRNATKTTHTCIGKGNESEKEMGEGDKKKLIYLVSNKALSLLSAWSLEGTRARGGTVLSTISAEATQ